MDNLLTERNITSRTSIFNWAIFFSFFSYSQIQRALQNSNDPVLALGGNFSSNADSHLVAVQRDEDTPSRNPMNNSDYETQAINIANKSRKGIVSVYQN